MSQGWIGVDLDGTLAEYHGWHGIEHIGPPIPKMLGRVKDWLAAGLEVRILTARCGESAAIPYINEWCRKHIGQALTVTDRKDYGMVELWDDRCVQIVPNTGDRADGTVSPEAVEAYIAALPWSDSSTDHDRTLVAGNLRALAACLRRGGVLRS